MILVDNYYDSSKVTLFKPFSGKDIDLPLIKRKTLLQYSGKVCKQILSFKVVLFINPDLSMIEFVLMMSYSDCLINESNIHQIRKKNGFILKRCDVKYIIYNNGLFYLLNVGLSKFDMIRT